MGAEDAALLPLLEAGADHVREEHPGACPDTALTVEPITSVPGMPALDVRPFNRVRPAFGGAVLLALAVVAGTAAPAPAAPAYRCSSSVQTIDDAGYSGPWPDNWEMTVRVCAARSGPTVHTYAEAWWDGPAYQALDDPTILDGAKLRVQIRRQDGALVATQDYPGIESRMEDSNGQGDHSGRPSGVIAYPRWPFGCEGGPASVIVLTGSCEGCA
ncbi:hypothetical protein [Streptomyces sp. H27-S2]|uniref:hypothetical protein n=1 Tax=Streptomyces antarcticus TaxID=2996458 RepID=UPI00226E1544|nr:hypothetical protein [Streptomyces sp. H27-S2]MCY0955245.1 hypothetical protein [Streptomyces sp. H27-S2]